jgi:DNA-binding transcriptional MerR regulator
VASPRLEDLLEPVDIMRFLRGLELSLGQVCSAASVSKTQLDYWTTRARIPTKGKKQRLYTLDALETVLLIKQGRDKGFSLQAAIEAAQRFKAAKAPRVPHRTDAHPA